MHTIYVLAQIIFFCLELTGEACFMELSNGIWTFSPFHCDRSGPPVLFNLLLHN